MGSVTGWQKTTVTVADLTKQIQEQSIQTSHLTHFVSLCFFFLVVIASKPTTPRSGKRSGGKNQREREKTKNEKTDEINEKVSRVGGHNGTAFYVHVTGFISFIILFAFFSVANASESCLRVSPETCKGSITSWEKVLSQSYSEELGDFISTPASTKLMGWNTPSGWFYSRYYDTVRRGKGGVFASAFGDCDGDGDIDMIAAVAKYDELLDRHSCNYQYFENVAAFLPNTPPNFELRPQNFTRGNIVAFADTCEVLFLNGGNAIYHWMKLVDMDNDGDLDFVLRHPLPPSYSSSSDVLYYENEGNSSHAKWVVTSNPFENFLNVNKRPALAFADLNNDNIVDVVSADTTPTSNQQSKLIEYYENNNSSTTNHTYTNRGTIVVANSFILTLGAFINTIVLSDIDQGKKYKKII